jgi:hypothetical protein
MTKVTSLDIATTKRSIFLSLAGGWTGTTLPDGGFLTTETSTNKVNFRGTKFVAAATDANHEFGCIMPGNYDGGTITAKAVLFVPTSEDASDHTIIFGLQGVAFADGDAGDTAYGTVQEVTITASADLEIGSGNYTWELWVYPTVDSGVMQSLIGTTNDNYTVSGGQIRRNSTKYPQFTFINTSQTAYFVIGTTTLEINTCWYHLAGVRYGDVIKLFVNGIQEGGDVACSGTQYDASGWYKVGSMSKKSGSTYYFPGYISELRISKGIARYTSNFTPQSSLFIPDANTSILLHFLGSGGSFVDSSPSPKTITANGNVTQLSNSPSAGCSVGFPMMIGV